ncbi:hypothetical protein M2451_000572 [Dysgonomonas sp. PFB1-18]|nr:hypothetical protein [Dysgonomonas sp. PF1-14]MDH6337341.1 hypothetical protein [Dysgonomonas sp. PF1-16]MDH6379265.1 hypothetical protein [Dysgonomonas sp. PFB1-18]MDH6396097.1 hypothetical protein [Dysgonomonas sp. PF1-23]
MSQYLSDRIQPPIYAQAFKKYRSKGLYYLCYRQSQQIMKFGEADNKKWVFEGKKMPPKCLL